LKLGFKKTLKFILVLNQIRQLIPIRHCLLLPKNFPFMIKIKNFTQVVSFFVFSFLTFSIFTGCWGGTQTSLPDAPPPYPDSPFPQGTNIYEDYTPPPSPDPRGEFLNQPQNSFVRGGNDYSSRSRVKSEDKFYTLEAIGTIWVLIQDKFGNELEWISLTPGDKVPLKHLGPLTITCSSGESLKINAPNGKPLQTGGTKKGISIIRLP
jgi:hypothetical protein